MEQPSVMPKTIKVSSRDKLFHKSLLLTLVLNVPVTQYDPNFEEYKKRLQFVVRDLAQPPNLSQLIQFTKQYEGSSYDVIQKVDIKAAFEISGKNSYLHTHVYLKISSYADVSMSSTARANFGRFCRSLMVNRFKDIVPAGKTPYFVHSRSVGEVLNLEEYLMKNPV